MTARSRPAGSSDDERRLVARGWTRVDMPDTGDGYGRWTHPKDGKIEIEHLTRGHGWRLHVPGLLALRPPPSAERGPHANPVRWLMAVAEEYVCPR